jgi:hypothetical protein
MDAWTFLDHLIGNLVWPTVVIIILYRFGKEIVKQLDRLTKLKVPGVESEFSDGIKQAEKTAEAANLPNVVPAPSVEKPVEKPTNTTNATEHWLNRYPELRIMESWKKVEDTASKKYGRITKGNWVIQVPQEIRPLYEQLRQLRNKASHARQGEINPADADEFAQLSERILVQIEETDAPPMPFQGSDKK